MGLPTVPPATSVSTIEPGGTGWAVFALQKALNSIRFAYSGATWERCVLDGICGDMTVGAVKAFQRWRRLAADGRAGPVTQASIVELLDQRAHALRPEVPSGLMRGLAQGEGGNLLGAVNAYTPPNGAKGVDCGVMQYRCYGPPFDQAALSVAFDPMTSMLRAADDFLGRVEIFFDQPGVKKRTDREEFAKRLAVLAHNWPAGAYNLADDGKLSDPDGTAAWVYPGTRFPDGAPVVTRLEWCQFYALGGPHGEGRITRYVTSWA